MIENQASATICANGPIEEQIKAVLVCTATFIGLFRESWACRVATVLHQACVMELCLNPWVLLKIVAAIMPVIFNVRRFDIVYLLELAACILLRFCGLE